MKEVYAFKALQATLFLAYLALKAYYRVMAEHPLGRFQERHLE
jgi:hypothetical protein